MRSQGRTRTAACARRSQPRRTGWSSTSRRCSRTATPASASRSAGGRSARRRSSSSGATGRRALRLPAGRVRADREPAGRARRVIAAVAAGHPATADAGLEILAEGGTAADAAVAAGLASCVAETVMTGLLGGGHAIHFDADRCARATSTASSRCRRDRGADGGAARPVRRGARALRDRRRPRARSRRAGGLDALWRAHGRLPWPRLVEPALRSPRRASRCRRRTSSCLAMLEPVMTMREGARIYAPGGGCSRRATARAAGLVRALQLLARRARRASTRLARRIAARARRERDGAITADDLAAYGASVDGACVGRLRGRRSPQRGGLIGYAGDARTLAPPAIARAARGARGATRSVPHTRRTSASSTATGTPCV
jgi:gamma-glutamyltranspeptidase/glutathione hydrolase